MDPHVTVSANAQNLSVNANLGAGADGGPISFTGAEVVLGNWCGTGETSLLAYYRPTAASQDSGGVLRRR